MSNWVSSPLDFLHFKLLSSAHEIFLYHLSYHAVPQLKNTCPTDSQCLQDKVQSLLHGL